MERTPGSDQSNETPGPELPLDYRPIFSQRLESIDHISHTPADSPPSAMVALLGLTSALHPTEIGLSGPAQAANSTERNQHLSELGLYQEIYPRDAHVTADLLWSKYPELTKATILASLPYTGTIDNLSSTEWIDEQEIGKIPHQMRDPEHPRSKRQFEIRRRGYPYYGAIDTTQKNILAISRVCLDSPPHSLAFLDKRYADMHGQPKSVLEGLEANTDWVLGRLSLNPEGLMESIQINPRHHANQSWADSPDPFHHADGSFARHHPDQALGVASVEVNAETYDALMASVRTYQTLLPHTDSNQADRLRTKIASLEAAATKLKQSIHEYFWVDDPELHGGYFARGTDRDNDGQLHPLQIRSSDMGHLLRSDVLDDDDPKVASIVKNLFSPEMLAANGVRTLSSDSLRYHQNAYHNGSVWPWDTYSIALGLEKRGYFGLARDLESRIMRFYQTTNTLAEYGSGDSEDLINLTQKVTVFDPELHPEPIEQFSLYDVIQPPQEIQAWTVASVMAIKLKNGQRLRSPERYPLQATDPVKRQLEIAILNQREQLDYQP